MGLVKKRAKAQEKPEVKAVPQSYISNSVCSLTNKNLSISKMRLYESLRDNIPIIDAAISKTAKLIGGCHIKCEDPKIQALLDDFVQNIRVNACSYGLETFINIYFEQMLTYGTAIGEIVLDSNNEICALYNASLEDVELKEHDSPLNIGVYVRNSNGLCEVACPELILLSALNAKPGCISGESILKGLPFVSDILMKIYSATGKNWERVGNVRYAVTYKPGNDSNSRAYSKQRAEILADEWQKAMSTQQGGVSDFICVGDVDIKVIGADNQILDSEIPVRQILEQIISKLSIPPFVLGLSWSTTERMASEQLDIFTSELNSYRRILTPIIAKICSLFLRTKGVVTSFEVLWEDIALKDSVDTATARLQNAKARQIEENLGLTSSKEE